jgi:colicin import membrane protein
MKINWLENIVAGSYSLIVHIILIGLFVIGMEATHTPKAISQPKVDIVQATVMDEAAILQEVARQQQAEDEKRRLEEERQDKIDKKLQETQEELQRKEQEFLDQQERAKLEQ